MREARDFTLSATECSRRTSCVAWDASVVLAGYRWEHGSKPPAEHLAPKDKAEDSELGDLKLFKPCSIQSSRQFSDSKDFLEDIDEYD